MALLSQDDLLRLMWRLPGWDALTALLRAMPSSVIPRNRVPPVDPGERILDEFMARATDGLLAGAGVADITPENPQGMYLAGFDYERRCLGVRDPLFARALFVRAGSTPLLIVTLDLIGLSLPRTERLRSLISSRFSDSILLVCTHNHQGPDTMGLWGPALGGILPLRSGLDPKYMDQLERAILLAVERALSDARPAIMGLAAGPFDQDGLLVHNERSPVVDRELRVMSFTDHSGQTIATLAQYACHPETLWSQNRLMSADFCAVCCQTMEQTLGGVGLYVNGSLGAMVSSSLDHHAGTGERESMVQNLGQSLGRAALELLQEEGLLEVDQAEISIARSPVTFPGRDNKLYSLIHALGVVEDRTLSSGLGSEVSFVRLGPASIMGLPGESAPALGNEILSRVPGQPRFVFGLTNDELGYLLPPEFFHDETYAYERTMTPGPQAATRLVLAVERLASARS